MTDSNPMTTGAGWILDWTAQVGGRGTTTFTLDEAGGGVGSAVLDGNV